MLNGKDHNHVITCEVSMLNKQKNIRRFKWLYLIQINYSFILLDENIKSI